ncbi:MAG TPA: hypothetical protein PKB06_09210, partial [Actinotalea sp.]|nr:hypothetical protein [Actinotalea sp.]
ERDATAAALTAAVPDPRLLEFGDGAVNHALYPIPVRHGFVFAGDAGSLRALQEGQAALSRGDFAAYGTAQDQLRRALEDAIAAEAELGG